MSRTTYRPEVLATMTDYNFKYKDGFIFRFTKEGKVKKFNTALEFDSMAQMFNYYGLYSARPSMCVDTDDGVAFPDLYSEFEVYYDDFLEEDEEEDFVNTYNEPSRVEIAENILDRMLNGEINVAGAVDEMFEQVKNKCGLPERVITKLDTLIKVAKNFDKVFGK